MKDLSVSPSLRLSKSKIAAFEHCAKRLWLQIHQRELGQFDEATLVRFRFGHAVGDSARKLFPGGVLVDTDSDMGAALARTAELVALPELTTIFEGTFQHEDVLIRADVLLPLGDGSWHAIEVKASSRVKAYQLSDLATQVWVMRKCGLNIARASICYLATLPGHRAYGRPRRQFRMADVSSAIEQIVAGRAEIAAKARATIRAAEPDLDMGAHCYQPLACEFRDYCQKASSIPSAPQDQSDSEASGSR